MTEAVGEKAAQPAPDAKTSGAEEPPTGSPEALAASEECRVGFPEAPAATEDTGGASLKRVAEVLEENPPNGLTRQPARKVLKVPDKFDPDADVDLEFMRKRMQAAVFSSVANLSESIQKSWEETEVPPRAAAPEPAAAAAAAAATVAAPPDSRQRDGQTSDSSSPSGPASTGESGGAGTTSQLAGSAAVGGATPGVASGLAAAWLLDPVEQFLSKNPVDERAAHSLRMLEPTLQRYVLEQGDLSGARNPSAALMGRIKTAWAETSELQAMMLSAGGGAATAGALASILPGALGISGQAAALGAMMQGGAAGATSEQAAALAMMSGAGAPGQAAALAMMSGAPAGSALHGLYGAGMSNHAAPSLAAMMPSMGGASPRGGMVSGIGGPAAQAAMMPGSSGANQQGGMMPGAGGAPSRGSMMPGMGGPPMQGGMMPGGGGTAGQGNFTTGVAGMAAQGSAFGVGMKGGGYASPMAPQMMWGGGGMMQGPGTQRWW